MSHRDFEIEQEKLKAMTEEFAALKSVRARRPLTPAEDARVRALQARFPPPSAPTGPTGFSLRPNDLEAIQRAHFEERDAFYAANGGYPKD